MDALPAAQASSRRTRLRPGAPSLALCALALLLSVGCGQAPVSPQAEARVAEPLVWPRPPAQARVRFVRNVVTPADWGVSSGSLQRLIDKLTGQAPFRFVRPTGVAARGSVLYVADPGAKALIVLDATNAHELRIGSIGRESLASPVAVALGPENTVFLVDSALRKIFLLDRQGNPLRTIGGEGRLARPAGVAYDPAADRLYVSDAAAHRIVVFSSDGQMLGTFGQSGSDPGEFNFPTHLAVTPEGDLLVTDTLNYRVQILARDGRPLARFGRVGDGSGDFASPKGVAADSLGNIYVVDALFDAVQVFRRDGSLLLGFGERGTRPGRFWLPNGLFIDANDKLYVADAYNQRVSIFERLRPSGPEADEQ